MSALDYRHGYSPDALADLPDGCAALVLTDPPYGTETDNSLYGRRARDGSRRLIAHDRDLAQLEATAPTMCRILAPDGVALVFCGPSRRRDAEDALMVAGLAVIGSLPWDKGSPGISYRIRYAYEDVLLAALPGVDPWDKREPVIVPVRFTPPQARHEHPHEKPVGLLRRYIAWACPTGGLVVDPFAGVASSAVAAHAEGCDWVGVECDEQWWPIAERRIAEAQNVPHHAIHQRNLFDLGAA